MFSFCGTLIIQTAKAAVQRTLKLQCLTESRREHNVHAMGLGNIKQGGKGKRKKKWEVKIIKI